MQVFKKATFHLVSVVEYIDERGLSEAEADKSDTRVTGTFRIEGDEITLSYTEKQSGSEVFTRIRVLEDSVVLERRGSIDAVMIFKEGEGYQSIYSVPPYQFDMSLYTRKIIKDLSQDGGELTLVYDAEVGGSKTACRMRIGVSLEK